MSGEAIYDTRSCRYVGYARCSTETQGPHRPTATTGRPSCEIASELEIIGRLDTAAVLINTSSHMPQPHAADRRATSRAKSGGIVGVDLVSLAVVSALPAVLWPGAGSNRRPSDSESNPVGLYRTLPDSAR